MRYQETREFENLYNSLVVKYVSGGDELANAYLEGLGYDEDFRREMIVFIRWHVDKSVELADITRARKYLSGYDWSDN